jgi:Leucine-rich repeat (LRR) protein
MAQADLTKYKGEMIPTAQVETLEALKPVLGKPGVKRSIDENSTCIVLGDGGITGLVVSGKKIEALPREVLDLPALHEVRLHKIKAMSAVIEDPPVWESIHVLEILEGDLRGSFTELGKMPNLRRLVMRKVDRVSIPSEIQYLKKLEYLELDDNQLMQIPLEINELESLQEFVFLHNRIFTYLPESLFDAPRLAKVTLNYNGISSFPPEVRRMASLEHLDLSHNDLMTIPEEIASCPRLRFLNLSQNSISSLPDEMCKMPALEVLDISNNPLSDLPDFTQIATLKQVLVARTQLSGDAQAMLTALKARGVKID